MMLETYTLVKEITRIFCYFFIYYN